MRRFAPRDFEMLPESYYNLKPRLKRLPRPPLHPATGEPLSPSDLEPLFPRGFITHEGSMEREVEIPGPVRSAYSIYRPTPLVRALGLERALDTPAEIYFKFEGVGPMGSHKSNTAIAQAFLAAEEGVTTLTTETGAGQWGSALSHAARPFGLSVRVFMVRCSFRQKPGRKTLMELCGASVVESPSDQTASGRRYYREDPNHPGSLGIAISEAVETAVEVDDVLYSLGSVLDAVMLHQSVIGLEARSQMEYFGAPPDVVVGCVGGGSNFAGLAFPFVGEMLEGGGRTRFVAVEPELCPTLTRGPLGYDSGDSAGLTPLVYMHSLGRDFVPPPIHAGGLRYHGMAPLVSHLVEDGIVEPLALGQDEVFRAGRLFLESEGVLPAPESSHAVAAAIREADRAREEGVCRRILLGLSGHGLLDLGAYEVS